MHSMLLLVVGLSTADARRHRHHAHRKAKRPPAHKVVRVQVRAKPWSPGWVPAHRPGYTWIGGRWVGGIWHPGHWRPIGGPPRIGMVFVVGHWEQEHYVDGYWVEPESDDLLWSDGTYSSDGEWTEGSWSSASGTAHQATTEPVSDPVETREIHALPPLD